MNNNNTTIMTLTQTPDKLLVIDREYLDKIKLRCDILGKEQPDIETRYDGIKNFIIELETNNSYPLSPIVEDAWNFGYYCEVNDKNFLDNYLSQPIKLEK